MFRVVLTTDSHYVARQHYLLFLLRRWEFMSVRWKKIFYVHVTLTSLNLESVKKKIMQSVH